MFLGGGGSPSLTLSLQTRRWDEWILVELCIFTFQYRLNKGTTCTVHEYYTYESRWDAWIVTDLPYHQVGSLWSNPRQCYTRGKGKVEVMFKEDDSRGLFLFITREREKVRCAIKPHQQNGQLVLTCSLVGHIKNRCRRL